jgi:hypothetical protein
VHARTTLYTDGTLPVERTEPAAEAKHERYEQWYARVNAECDCNKAEKCGNKYKAIMQSIEAEGATSNAQLRHRLNTSLSRLTSWRTGSRHARKQSATCDHARMPRELLPRIRRSNTLSPDKWPYLSQSTINDVRAIRCIRSAHTTAPFSTMWETLQGRLQQHAATSAGSVAEAIVANDYWWNGQVAHEKPSGALSKAMKRRYSKA